MATNKTEPTQRTKLDESRHERLVNALAVGVFRTVAAEHAGIHRSTLYAWLERGEADWQAGKDTPHAKLHEAVLSAEASAEHRCAELIQSAAKEDWRAAAWFLERRHQDRWGGKVAVEHSGKVDHQMGELSEAELERIVAGLGERRTTA